MFNRTNDNSELLIQIDLLLSKKLYDFSIMLRKEIIDMTAAVTALTAQVATNVAVEGSASTLIGTLGASQADPNEEAEINALTAQLAASATGLQAAINANPPATVTPTPTPTVEAQVKKA